MTPTDAASPSPAAAHPADPAPDAPASRTAPPDDAELEALLRLRQTGAGAAARALLDAHGSARAVRAAGQAAWIAAGLDPRRLGPLRGVAAPGLDDLLARCRAWLAAPDHHLIDWRHPDYPALLRRSPHPPLLLFVAGDPQRLWHPAVAVVGSRGPTPGGRDNARTFALALGRTGLGVFSGLAAGIDQVAHEAALAVGAVTVAVLGTGPDVPYPARHADLHARIAAHGAVVSEHPPGTGPRREHFPSRNRILAGLCLGTLVVEAAERSGALITARLAAEAGREVFALPGSIHNPMARGCHRLIRDGAALVESPAEIVAALPALAARLGDALRDRLRLDLADPAPPVPPDAPMSTGTAATPARRSTATAAPTPGRMPGTAGIPPLPPSWPPGDDHHRLWDALGHDPTDMDTLVSRSGLTAAALSSMLVGMELQGLVSVEHGRFTRRIHSILSSAPPGASQGT